MSENEYSELLDSVDAAIFTGELLQTNLDEMKGYMERWQRAIDALPKYYINLVTGKVKSNADWVPLIKNRTVRITQLTPVEMKEGVWTPIDY